MTIAAGRHAALAFVVAVSLGCEPGAGDPTPRSEPRVVLFLLDAARADHFSGLGYPQRTTPAMDALAAEGAVFAHHYAAGVNTRESLPRLLTSRYLASPLFGYSVHVAAVHPLELFRRPDPTRQSITVAFAAAGFRTGAISAHLWIAPGSRMAREFDDFEVRFEGAEALVDRGLAWLRRHRDEPAFLYLHLMDTHFPHAADAHAMRFFGESGYDPSRVFEETGRPRPGAVLDERDRRFLRALYDGSLARTDAAIGRFVAGLRRDGLLADSILAITSDHGEHLLEVPGRFEHPAELGWLEAVSHVPLILFAPGRLAPVRFDGLSHAVDVTPTLLALAGVEATGRFDGVDLRALVEGRVPRREALVVPDAIRTRSHRALFDQSVGAAVGAPTPRGRLYDLRADPLEQRDLAGAQPERLAALWRELERQLAPRVEAYERFLPDPPPPDSAFAVDVGGFQQMRPEPTREGPGWRRVGRLPPRLHAPADAGALELELALPDGRYEWSARFRGQLQVAWEGRTRVVEGDGGLVPIGATRVEGQRFVARFDPRSTVTLSALGFVPANRPDADANDRRLERLRALGYVEE